MFHHSIYRAALIERVDPDCLINRPYRCNTFLLITCALVDVLSFSRIEHMRQMMFALNRLQNDTDVVVKHTQSYRRIKKKYKHIQRNILYLYVEIN